MIQAIIYKRDASKNSGRAKANTITLDADPAKALRDLATIFEKLAPEKRQAALARIVIENQNAASVTLDLGGDDSATGDGEGDGEDKQPAGRKSSRKSARKRGR